MVKSLSNMKCQTSTGVIIPNLNALDIGFFFVITVVVIIGTWSLYTSLREIKTIKSQKELKT